MTRWSPLPLQPLVSLPIPLDATHLCVSDVDSDGWPELLIATSEPRLHVFNLYRYQCSCSQAPKDLSQDPQILVLLDDSALLNQQVVPLPLTLAHPGEERHKALRFLQQGICPICLATESGDDDVMDLDRTTGRDMDDESTQQLTSTKSGNPTSTKLTLKSCYRYVIVKKCPSLPLPSLPVTMTSIHIPPPPPSLSPSLPLSLLRLTNAIFLGLDDGLWSTLWIPTTSHLSSYCTISSAPSGHMLLLKVLATRQSATATSLPSSSSTFSSSFGQFSRSGIEVAGMDSTSGPIQHSSTGELAEVSLSPRIIVHGGVTHHQNTHHLRGGHHHQDSTFSSLEPDHHGCQHDCDHNTNYPTSNPNTTITQSNPPCPDQLPNGIAVSNGVGQFWILDISNMAQRVSSLLSPSPSSSSSSSSTPFSLLPDSVPGASLPLRLPIVSALPLGGRVLSMSLAQALWDPYFDPASPTAPPLSLPSIPAPLVSSQVIVCRWDGLTYLIPPEPAVPPPTLSEGTRSILPPHSPTRSPAPSPSRPTSPSLVSTSLSTRPESHPGTQSHQSPPLSRTYPKMSSLAAALASLSSSSSSSSTLSTSPDTSSQPQTDAPSLLSSDHRQLNQTAYPPVQHTHPPPYTSQPLTESRHLILRYHLNERVRGFTAGPFTFSRHYASAPCLIFAGMQSLVVIPIERVDARLTCSAYSTVYSADLLFDRIAAAGKLQAQSITQRQAYETRSSLSSLTSAPPSMLHPLPSAALLARTSLAPSSLSLSAGVPLPTLLRLRPPSLTTVERLNKDYESVYATLTSAAHATQSHFSTVTLTESNATASLLASLTKLHGMAKAGVSGLPHMSAKQAARHLASRGLADTPLGKHSQHQYRPPGSGVSGVWGRLGERYGGAGAFSVADWYSVEAAALAILSRKMHLTGVGRLKDGAGASIDSADSYSSKTGKHTGRSSASRGSGVTQGGSQTMVTNILSGTGGTTKQYEKLDKLPDQVLPLKSASNAEALEAMINHQRHLLRRLKEAVKALADEVNDVRESKKDKREKSRRRTVKRSTDDADDDGGGDGDGERERLEEGEEDDEGEEKSGGRQSDWERRARRERLKAVEARINMEADYLVYLKAQSATHLEQLKEREKQKKAKKRGKPKSSGAHGDGADDEKGTRRNLAKVESGEEEESVETKGSGKKAHGEKEEKPMDKAKVPQGEAEKEKEVEKERGRDKDKDKEKREDKRDRLKARAARDKKMEEREQRKRERKEAREKRKTTEEKVSAKSKNEGAKHEQGESRHSGDDLEEGRKALKVERKGQQKPKKGIEEEGEEKVEDGEQLPTMEDEVVGHGAIGVESGRGKATTTSKTAAKGRSSLAPLTPGNVRMRPDEYVWVKPGILSVADDLAVWLSASNRYSPLLHIVSRWMGEIYHRSRHIPSPRRPLSFPPFVVPSSASLKKSLGFVRLYEHPQRIRVVSALRNVMTLDPAHLLSYRDSLARNINASLLLLRFADQRMQGIADEVLNHDASAECADPLKVSKIGSILNVTPPTNQDQDTSASPTDSETIKEKGKETLADRTDEREEEGEDDEDDSDDDETEEILIQRLQDSLARLSIPVSLPRASSKSSPTSLDLTLDSITTVLHTRLRRVLDVPDALSHPLALFAPPQAQPLLHDAAQSHGTQYEPYHMINLPLSSGSITTPSFQNNDLY